MKYASAITAAILIGKQESLPFDNSTLELRVYYYIILSWQEDVHASPCMNQGAVQGLRVKGAVHLGSHKFPCLLTAPR